MRGARDEDQIEGARVDVRLTVLVVLILFAATAAFYVMHVSGRI